jgi:pyrimidine deaminase RibD-like protein
VFDTDVLSAYRALEPAIDVSLGPVQPMTPSYTVVSTVGTRVIDVSRLDAALANITGSLDEIQVHYRANHGRQDGDEEPTIDLFLLLRRLMPLRPDDILLEADVIGPDSSRTEYLAEDLATRLEQEVGSLNAFKEPSIQRLAESTGSAISAIQGDIQVVAGEGFTPAPTGNREYMELAIALARQCKSEKGRISPKVGAVVVTRDGRVEGACRGELEPGEHAEFTLLERKLGAEILAGATLFTTLEPCTGRNRPKIPCAERIIERKIARVVIGMLDPNDAIRGRGQLRLRQAGIEIGVFDADLMDQIEELNREFTRDQLDAKPMERTEAQTSQQAGWWPGCWPV